MHTVLIVVLAGAIVLILGKLHSYYLDENERIMRGERSLTTSVA